MNSYRVADDEDVAVVGIGLRLPGGIDTIREFWDFIMSGREATGLLPAGRWEGYEEGDAATARAVTDVTRAGSYLEDAAGFDAAFFGITPREAELMDPQQRIMLEVVWQALEHAGLVPDTLGGTDTGVFVGVGSDDYGRQMLEDIPRIEAWTGIGASMCGVANRVSYLFDFRGPSLAVDTACSASLVALHLAAASVRSGESPVAIAGGVNVIAGPGLSRVLDTAGATSSDGRSRSFDEGADGYGRGEGCGALVLKSLRDARRDGDRVHAVIRGSAVNQDGRTNGIMAPNEEAQEHVIRRALTQAGVRASSVGYVEAHGTGTRTGDPIELNALGRVYGEDRTGPPCRVGSVKANIGHLEAGAGIASLIKAVLTLSEGELPPVANLTDPTTQVDWSQLGLAPVTEPLPWPREPGDAAPRRAGVSGFGYGGTIGHVVLEEAPVAEEPGGRDAGSPGLTPGFGFLPLSGTSTAAVRDYADRLARWLESSEGKAADAADLAYTLLARRNHLSHRAAVPVGPDDGAEEIAASLRELRDDETAVTRASPMAQDAVWVFSGQGSHWVGMGRELLATEPVFAAVIDDLSDVFAEEIGFVPREVLLNGDFEAVHRAQPMIFAMQMGLDALWRDKGLRPAATIGHSVGEIAAAVSSGRLSRRDGARLVCRRSNLLRRVEGNGAMIVVSLSFDAVEGRLADEGVEGVVAAIVASPESTVLSGDRRAIEGLGERWSVDGLEVQRVNSDVAFHSPQMDCLLDELRAAASDLEPTEPTVPMYSTARIDPCSDPGREAGYWAENLRRPVRLTSAAAAALEDGHELYLEIAGHPVVRHSLIETFAAEGRDDVHIGVSTRRNRSEPGMLASALVDLYRHGTVVRWTGESRRVIDIPPTAWQHQRFWRAHTPSTGGQQEHDPATHSLLGVPQTVAGAPSLRIWQTRLNTDNQPYPVEHLIHGTAVVPAAVTLGTLLDAAPGNALTDVRLVVPMPVTGGGHDVQVVRSDEGIRVASRPGGGSEGWWVTHATASVRPTPDVPAPIAPLIAPAIGTEAVSQRLEKVGATAGFDWKITSLCADGVRLEAIVEVGVAGWASALDAVFGIAPLLFDDDGSLRMPSVVELLTVISDRTPSRVLVRVARAGGTTEPDIVDVDVVDPADDIVLGSLRGLRFGVFEEGDATQRPPEELLHELVWLDVAPAAVSRRDRPVVVVGDGDGDAFVGELARTLRADRGDDRGVSIVPFDDLTVPDLPNDADVVLVPDLDGTDLADDALSATWQLVRAAQLALTAGCGQRLWTVTRGLAEASSRGALAQAPLVGLSRVFAGEQPEYAGGIVDLSPAPAAEDLSAVAALLGEERDEDAYEVRDGSVRVARLRRAVRTSDLPGLTCRAGASYVVTGGLGALGLEVARWLVGRGARELVLVGRTALPSVEQTDDPAVRAQCEAVHRLRAAGAEVRTVALDIADEDEARRALDPDALGMSPVAGVVHAAGVVDGRSVDEVDRSPLAEVFRPKVAGALTLDALYPPGSLDFLVLFSSNGLLLGIPGQACYASANAFLDALARHRRYGGHTDTQSIAWTSWRGSGMGDNPIVAAELVDRGIGKISPIEAFGAWAEASRLSTPHAVVMPTVGVESGVTLRPVLRELDIETFEREGAGLADGVSWEELDDTDRAERVAHGVRTAVAGEAGLRLDELDSKRPFFDLGFDSVMTTAIRRRIEKHFRLALPATLLWNRPTVDGVVGHILPRLAEAEETSASLGSKDEPEQTA